MPISPQDNTADESKEMIQGRWLVFTSLILTFLIEVLPSEVGYLTLFVRTRNIPAYIGAKAVFLFVILLPLFIYFWKNGSAAYKAVRGRLIIIGIIVGLHLLGNIAVLIKLITD